MRNIFLPTLKKIRIENFTLYPNGLDFNYEFINGVNLIIGGNGMGKTTLVNIIKYAIIGHYKKHFEFTRTYQDRKIEKRVLYPLDYYRNRLDYTIQVSSRPTVTIEFEINTDRFVVTRSLDSISLEKFYLNGVEVAGEILPQNKYELLKDTDRPYYLQAKYEAEISKSSGLSFDDLIFFINEILYFGEDHKTILWNDGNSGNDVQNELFNKYFNTPELDNQRQEAERQAKYFNSLSRHRSEDIRAIRKVLDKVAPKDNSETPESISAKILNSKKLIEDLDRKIERKQDERKKFDNNILLLNNQINDLSLQESDLERSKKVAENKLLEKRWMHLHKHYDMYLQGITTNGVCPMCSKELNEKFRQEKLEQSLDCFLCGQEINELDSEDLNLQFQEINLQFIQKHTEIQNIQKEIKGLENSIKTLDTEFRALSSEKRELHSSVRNLEYLQSQKSDDAVDQLQAFYDEIETLEKLKSEYQEKSKTEQEKAEKISQLIESRISKETNRFSLLFSEFAGEFLGVKCSLTYTDTGNGIKRFYPVIDNKIRHFEEELSESQRFFIDHSFRMSILSFFYNKPAFYIVETPDSSLDISYEKNAANVFIKFLENPNALILTSNLNNSEFLNHLIDSSKDNLSVISLLEIGKKSIIQSASNAMTDIYNKLKKKI